MATNAFRSSVSFREATVHLTNNMTSNNTANSSSGSSPFDWLSGGLGFFNKGGDEDIDSCNDVLLLLNGVQDNLQTLLEEETTTNTNDKDENKKQQDCSKFLQARLRRIRFLLYDERRLSSEQKSGGGSSSSSTKSPLVANKTMEALTTTTTTSDSSSSLNTLMPKLIKKLCSLPFESRKDVAAIFNYLLVCGLDGNDGPLYIKTMVGFRDYTLQNLNEILTSIVDGHDCTITQPDVVLHCGSMYRSCLKHEILYRKITESTSSVETYIFPFLDKFVHSPNFDVASDAMETLRLILTVEQQEKQGGSTSDANQNNNYNNNKRDDETMQQSMNQACADFLNRDYDAIFQERFNPKLLNTNNSEESTTTTNNSTYIVRRVALQILSTVLLTRSNYAIMMKYISQKHNLILCMLLLRDTSPHITLDAFHVFKIFVANPNKPPEICKILKDNQVKLVKYLETLHKEKEMTDAQFRDEKALVISTIDGLT